MKHQQDTPAEWLPFLSGGDQMGAMMRAHDWSNSPLGHPREWPQALRTTVGLMLNAKFPMFVAWGAELGFLYNDSYATILGEKHPSAMGRRFHDIWCEIWDDIHPLIVRALRGEATYMHQLPLRMRRHGYDEDTWFRFSYSPVRTEDGTVAGMFCACVEITAEVLAERYREEENQRLLALFEQAPSVIAVLRGPTHVFELTNRAYQQLIGHRELLGKTVAEALPEIAEQGFIALLDQVYQSGEPFVGRAVPVRVQREASGPMEELFVDFVYQPIRGQKGEVTGIFVEGNDVTARKRVEDDLRAANRQKDQFLAMLAHELRNPLAPITTAAQLLQRGALDPQRARHASDIIVRQAEHMSNLVNDLLDVSRVTRGLADIGQEALDVADVVHGAVEQVRPLLDLRRHELVLQIGSQPLPVVGDRTRLVQVVSNILNNAAKYTPPGGTIVLGAAAEANEAVITVRDNGQGIEQQVLPYIFDLFTQAERTPDRSQGGLGIGLALVKSLVALHGGRVAASSGGANQGSEFVVRLPLLEGAPAPLDAQHTRLPAAGPVRVLVVDDNADAAHMLATLLEAHGHLVSVEHDGSSGFARAQLERPQAMLLDIGLPDMDGHELARRLRGCPETAGATLIALTGYGQREDRERALAAGFDRHMVKPADLSELLDILARVRGPAD
jgi:PAS domain S-box-containing protein